MTTIKSALGSRIRQLRKQKGLTQFQAAEAAGIDPKSLSRLESGVFNPSIDTLQRLARAMGTEIEDFFLSDVTWARSQRGFVLEVISKATDKEIALIAEALEGILKKKRTRKPSQGTL
ncbi:helix-turn-helix domain-containing protein [Duganella sp. Dugasp56]|uniref:helix-turn-helix domain-containing protein n=1 Tax=Duganella sp. Dugasp56 TaxID=3243046 RepID=UPI0039AED8AF